MRSQCASGRQWPQWHVNNSSDCSEELDCNMSDTQKGEFDTVVILRLFTAGLSILGASSIVGSAIYKKTACNPKVHPIFVLSIVDVMLSFLWMSGSVLWLTGGAAKQNSSRVGCFAISLTTISLQCVAMNVTLIYSLLAYFSIKQRDFSSVYVMPWRPVSVHVWHPVRSFIAYSTAWLLPMTLIVIPFGVLSQKYQLVRKANKCSCWCLPFFGNVLPRPPIGYHNGSGGQYLDQLHYFITSYSVLLAANYLVVFSCMVVIYYKVFRRIRNMILQQEISPLLQATQAMIIEHQKDARNRVFLFFCIYIITGTITFVSGIANICIVIHPGNPSSSLSMKRAYIFLVLEAITVPIQGFLNALAYGWTRGDFRSVMSLRHHSSQADSSHGVQDSSQGESEKEEEVTDVEIYGEEWQEVKLRREGSLSVLIS